MINGLISISVYSVNGKLIISQQLRSNKEMIDISGLKPGTYLIKMEGNGKKSEGDMVNFMKM